MNTASNFSNMEMEVLIYFRDGCEAKGIWYTLNAWHHVCHTTNEQIGISLWFDTLLLPFDVNFAF